MSRPAPLRTRVLAALLISLVCLATPVLGASDLGPSDQVADRTTAAPGAADISSPPLSLTNETTSANSSSETTAATTSTATPQRTTTADESGDSPTTTTTAESPTTAENSTHTGESTTTTTTGETTTTTNENTTTTGENTTTADENATETDATAETVWLRGTLLSAAGEPLRNDTVYVETADGNRTSTRTNESGAFAVRTEPNRTYSVVYRQQTPNGSADDAENATVASPDGVPDVHVLEGAVNSSTGVDFGTQSLPTAHTVEVRARDGESPVTNGSAELRIAGDVGRSATNVTVDGTTGGDGQVEFTTYGTRIEIADSTEIRAAGVRPETTYEERTVTENASIELVADDEPPTLRTDVVASPVNVGRNTTIRAANSSDDTGIRLYRWDTPHNHFTTPNPNFTTPLVPSAGDYNVTVTVVDGAGRTSTDVVRIPVVDEIRPAAAVDVSDRTPTVGEPLTLDASGASDNHRIAEYRWDTDGDGEYEEVTETPTYRTAYESIGERQFDVEVVDPANNTASATGNVTIRPNATIRASDTEVGVGEQVRFEVARKAPNVTYEWTYNDTLGSGATAANFTTRTVSDITGNQSYEVTLEATSDDGLTATSNETVRVVNYPPNVTVDAPTVAEAGSKVALDASGTTDRDADRPLTFDWTQTNGTNVSLSNADGATASFTAPEVLSPTTLNFTVSAADEHGRTAERRVSVPVRPAPELEFSPYAYPNETVAFSVSNVADGRDAITEYRWRFGDGGESANRTPTHRYPETETYPVTLRLDTGRGEPTAVSSPISVIPRPEVELPKAEIVAANATASLRASVPEGVVGETYTWRVSPANGADNATPWNGTLTRVTESPTLNVTAPSNVTRPLALDVTVEILDIKGGNDTANTTLTVTPDEPRNVSEDDIDGDDTSSSGGSTGASSVGSSSGGSSSAGGSSGGGASGGGTGGSSSSGGSGGGIGSSGGGNGGGGSSGPSVGGGSGGASSPSDRKGTPAPSANRTKAPEPEVEVRPGDGSAATVTVRNASHGGEVAISLPQNSDAPSSAGFESIDLVTPPEESDADVNDSFGLRTRQRRAAPSDVSAPPVETAFSYLTVRKDGIDNAAIESATFTFRVEKSVLGNRGVDPDAVTLYRYHDGEWSALPTSVVRNATDAVVFDATTPGFSTFAIGVPHTEPTDSLRNSSGPGEATAASATAGNARTNDSATETASAEPPSSASEGERDDAQRWTQSPDRSGVGISTVYIVALLVTVVCAVLWGYLLQQRD